MIWKCILRRIMTFICRAASVDIWYIHWIFIKKQQQQQQKKQQKTKTKQKKSSQKKFNVNTTVPRHAWWDFRGVLDDTLLLYLGFDMNKYFKNWGNHARSIVNNWGIYYYCCYYLFIGALWDTALCCDNFIREFGIFLYWPFHTYSSQFLLMYFCVYIHFIPLCCMPHLLIFLRCSLAFVILPVSILLVFMSLFSEPCFLLYTPQGQKTPWFSVCPLSGGGHVHHAIP